MSIVIEQLQHHTKSSSNEIEKGVHVGAKVKLPAQDEVVKDDHVLE
jgi:hypothetical protein